MQDYRESLQPESAVDAARLVLAAALFFLTPFLWENGLWMADRFWIDMVIFASVVFLFADSTHNGLSLPILGAVLLLLGAYGLSTVCSEVPALSMMSLRLLSTGVLWALVVAAWNERWRLRLALLLLGVIACLLLSQFFEFLHAVILFGWDAFGVQASGRAQNPNLLCALLLGSLPWTLVLWREGGVYGRRASVALWGAGLVSFVIAGSRTGMAAVVLTSFAAVLLLGKKHRRILLGGAGIFFTAASLFYLPRFLSLFNPEHITNVQRIHMMRAGLAMGAEHPFVGWGPGTIGEVYPLFQSFDKWELHLHSLPLQLWAETGLLGLLAGLALLSAIGYEAVHKKEDPARCAALLSIVGLFSCQLTDYLFWIPAASLLFWTNLGVLAGWGNERLTGLHKGLRYFAPVVVLAGIPMILFPQLGLRQIQSGDSALARGDYDAAIAHFDRAEELLGRHPLPPLLEAVARLRVTEGQSEEALYLLRRAHERDPLCTVTRELMGWNLAQRGFLEEAEDLLESAREQDPLSDWGPSSLDLAYILFLKGDRDEMEQVLRDSALIHPNLTRYFAAEILKEPSLWDQVKPEEELDPFYTQDLLYGTQSRYSWSGSYFERSEEALREAIQASPLHYPIRTALAARLIEQEHYEEALEESTTALNLCARQYAADPHLLFIHGMALKQLGRRDESEEFMEAAVRAGKRVAQPARNLVSLNYRLPLRASLNSGLWAHPGRW